MWRCQACVVCLYLSWLVFIYLFSFVYLFLMCIRDFISRIWFPGVCTKYLGRIMTRKMIWGNNYAYCPGYKENRLIYSVKLIIHCLIYYWEGLQIIYDVPFMAKWICMNIFNFCGLSTAAQGLLNSITNNLVFFFVKRRRSGTRAWFAIWELYSFWSCHV